MDVLLYSKFSNSSKKLMSQLQKTPDLLNSLTLTCIDNKQIRDQILSDQKVKVNVLPCLIRLNETSENFDIYEGQNAFDFFTSLQKEMKLQLEADRNQEMKMQEMKMQEMKLQEMRMQEMRMQEMKLQEMKLQEMSLKSDKEKDKEKEKDKSTEDILRNAKRQESERHTSQNKLEEYKNPLKQKISTSLSSEPVTFTTIDDLGLNEEDEDGEVAINTYVHVEKNSNSENSERDVSSKKAETSVKGNSLLTKAMQMQKDRN